MPQVLASPNRFFDRSGAARGGNVANSESLYQMAHYQIEQDEALVIDFVPPKTRFWNPTSASIWHESERFLTEPVSLTLDEVEARENGSVRFVLAHRNPGVPNWLETFEHTRGFLIFRMVGVASNPLPSVRRVKWAELSSAAAADAAAAARGSRAPSP